MTRAASTDDPGPPDAGVLESLDADAWASLLPLLRRALHDLDDTDSTARIQRLRAAPAGRLAGGRPRRDLSRLIAAGGPLWDAVRERLLHEDHPAATWLLDDQPPPVVAATTPSSPAPERAVAGADRAQRDKARRLQAERDQARRQAAGAEARVGALEAEVARLKERLAHAEEDRATLWARLEAAAEAQQQAVARERRRRDREVATLREELAALRRAQQERVRREQEQRRAREAEKARQQARRREQETARREARGPRVVPGRPSRLPSGVVPDTVEGVKLLLHPGRLLLVDGYNVTLQHRADFTLEEQRAWLIQQLAALARRRRVRPVVIFDGERSSGARTPGARDVDVRFTAAGITADDELVLAVEGTDDPVLVVTDDRDLRTRLAATGADVVRTAPFVGAL